MHISFLGCISVCINLYALGNACRHLKEKTFTSTSKLMKVPFYVSLHIKIFASSLVISRKYILVSTYFFKFLVYLRANIAVCDSEI